MELSVIIVSYNVRYFLEQCLNSVHKAAVKINCEIFVVDNNSTDGSCSMVNREFPEAKLIINQVNRGFSAANNQALKLATGKYILLLNPDTIVEEDTFTQCIDFMESHPEAGAMGVRMINGKGRFVPDSKRSLPTPKTAFFKITGLARIFPKSELFSKYYLGNLDNLKTTEADILSGAFMFLRKEAVDKIGYLDECFFLHGEDIDYSYRLHKAGYRNYYFPDARIIHFKGESTKKEDLNIFISFYRAMLTFVSKHFNNNHSGIFILFIKTAIFLSAGLSLGKRLIRKIFLPLTEGIIIYLNFRFITSFWGTFKFGADYNFPEVFTGTIIPVYAIITLCSIALTSGYRIPVRLINALKGIFYGTLFILIIYALLPVSLRFSRAIIIFGELASLAAVPLWRVIVSFVVPGIADNPFRKAGSTVVVSGPEGYFRIKELMASAGAKNMIAGRVSINQEDLGEDVLGNISQIKEVIRINRIKEVIFTSSELSAAQIIDNMHLISEMNIGIKIAATGERFIIGSRYVNPREIIIPSTRISVTQKASEILREFIR